MINTLSKHNNVADLLSISRRVGLSNESDKAQVTLPPTVAEVQGNWKVVERSKARLGWDFVWITPSEDLREKQFVEDAFTLDEVDYNSGEHVAEHIAVSEVALKVQSTF